MNIEPYNTEQRTEIYLNQLGRWVNKIGEYKSPKKPSRDDKWLRKLDMFPINIKGDILLMIEPESFAYHSSGQRQSVFGNELKDKPCEVIGLFDNTTGDYHGPPEGDYDLEVKIIKDNLFLYIDPHFVAYATSFLPPYVFLPFPERLKDFSRFLLFFAKKPERLEKILNDYYKSLR